MSPKNEQETPRKSAKSAAIVALVAALAGGTGGVVITPRVAGADYLTRQELAEALRPLAAKLESIESRVTVLGEEAAVARYEREHRGSP